MLGPLFIFSSYKKEIDVLKGDVMWWFIGGVAVGAIIVFTIWTCCVLCGLYDEKEGTK